MNSLDKQYDPARVEDRWYAFWEKEGLFHADAGGEGEPYCIVIPPPNVTGILHMGHALNNTLQDVLVRWRRMTGRNALWVPGTDHAGIATQNVVERALREEGLTRDDLGREAFLERVWAWRRQYGDTITRQLRKLGCACDWKRERFTMDEGLSRAVEEVFIRLYERGLVYRGQYIINWCPRCRTALSDEESEHQDVDGHLYYFRYPVLGGGRKKTWITVATTRPETMLGDTAVAVNPHDERYRELIGCRLRLPLVDRDIPVIADDFVDPAFGTGAVKVTPAHDPNDFEMGRRHELPSLDVMDEGGIMNAAAGPYAGLDRLVCRERVVADLKGQGLLEKTEAHRHAVGHCYRCHTLVEPRLSAQWFVRMKPLAGPAIEAVREGRVRFVPERWTKVYLEWMENIRDWCISRQIWWGHRIPVFYCDSCEHQWAARGVPAACPACGVADVRQDEDVLDTWFSSWLWPFSVFGWPEETPDLKRFYPTQTLVTGSEIIFFWVARMIMAGIEFMGDSPFSEVYINGTVRDDHGRKMSKSLGNSIDPLSVIEVYGTDALRFSLIHLNATGQDLQLADEKFEIGRNFCTKIWNAARFFLLQAGEAPPPAADEPLFDPARLSPDDRHILARLDEAVVACSESLERFRFNDYAHALHDFIWHRFCDHYLEYAKDILRGGEAESRARTLGVMRHVFGSVLRLLHPLMPFLSEELWQQMGYAGGGKSILLAPWPEPLGREGLERWGIDQDLVDYVEAKHDLVRVARMLMADYNLLPRHGVRFLVRPARKAFAARLTADAPSLAALLRAAEVRITASVPKEAMPGGLCGLGDVFMPVEDLIDVEAEVKRLSTQAGKIAADLQRVNAKLSNEHFMSKAPREVVSKQEDIKRELLEKSKKLEKLIAALSG